MKINTYLLTIVLLLSLTSAHAQIRFGLKGGITRAYQDYGIVDVPEDAERHVMGLNISVLAEYTLSKHLSVEIAPGFAERGAACIPGFIVFEGDTKFFLDYAEAPLMLKGNLALFGERMEVFAKVGYGASYLLAAQREDTPANDQPIARENISLGKNSILNRWDHGAYGAVGIGVNVGKTQMFVTSDLYVGLRNAERANFSQNRGLSLNVGVSREFF